jgi:DNA polymerase III subunit epsilon
MRLIALDTETTGLEVRSGHRVIEIGAVEIVARRVAKAHFHVYLNPERDIPAEAREVHGLTEDFLADKPLFAHVARDFWQFVEGAELLAHNADFDIGFLDAELARQNLPSLRSVCRITDTVALARQQYPGKRNTLDALCERLGVDNSRRTFHGALLDATLLAEVYLAMTRGQDSLAIGLTHPAASETRERRPRPATLRVVRATPDEGALHTRLVQGLDKAAGRPSLWAQWHAEAGSHTVAGGQPA